MINSAITNISPKYHDILQYRTIYYKTKQKTHKYGIFIEKLTSKYSYVLLNAFKIHEHTIRLVETILRVETMATATAGFLEVVSFDNLLKCTSVDDLKLLKKEKEVLCKGRCKCKNTSQFFCKPCANINRKMCRVYHDTTPFEELVLRLAYEYMFDIVSETDLRTGKWYGTCLRDEGHHERIRRLKARASRQLANCKWLQV